MASVFGMAIERGNGVTVAGGKLYPARFVRPFRKKEAKMGGLEPRGLFDLARLPRV